MICCFVCVQMYVIINNNKTIFLIIIGIVSMKRDLMHIFLVNILEVWNSSTHCFLCIVISHTFQCNRYITIACTGNFIIYALHVGPFSWKRCRLLLYYCFANTLRTRILLWIYILTYVSVYTSHFDPLSMSAFIKCTLSHFTASQENEVLKHSSSDLQLQLTANDEVSKEDLFSV